MARQPAGGVTSAAPKFLNLAAIRFPVGAIASILHRISGVLLVVALPVLARALGDSLSGPEGFEAVLDAALRSWFTPLLFVGIWALVHHVFAGVRHLLMDVGVGVRLPQARASAFVSIAAGIVAALAWLVAWGVR